MVTRRKNERSAVGRPTQTLTDHVDALLLQVEAEECRRSLKTFMRGVWPIIEPTPFADGMPIDAMVEHLEAVTRGDIRRLVINIPPRHTKSSLLTIWRAWSWVQNSAERFLCASYSLDLSTRDNLRVRRIIEDPWFQARFGKTFQLAGDQNVKRYFENTERGYQMAISVDGGTTGQGGSILVCLCYNTEVTTDQGRLCIGDIVEKHLPVRVLAFDHKSHTARWQNIEEYESSVGRSSVCVTCTDGRFIEATTDHPFYVIGKGYVHAAQLVSGDEVVTDESYLRSLRQRVQPQTVTNCEIQTKLLQPSVPLQGSVEREPSSIRRQNKSLELPSVRQGVCESGGARYTTQRHFLQSCLSWCMGKGREQSCLSGWACRANMQDVLQSILSQAKSCCCWGILLLKRMQREVSAGEQFATLSRFVRQLHVLWSSDKDNQAKNRETQLLFSQMCKSCSQRIYQWGEQWAIYRWWGSRALFLGFPQTCSINSRTRWTEMQALPDDEGREWQGIRRSSHRLRQGSQQCFQSCLSLPLLPWENAWVRKSETPVERLLVRCVEPIPTPERVYNLRVAEDHNYFANGVLVHNCDDPHNADEAHSDTERNTAITWFREVWTNRLNDQEKDKMVVVGQRIHDDDVCGYILKERPDWIHLNLPAYYEPNHPCVTPIWKDPRTEEGQLLWPERFSKSVLDGLKRDLGSMGFAAQYQQRPVPAGGGQFKKLWFRYFTAESDYYVLETPEGIARIQKSKCWYFSTVDLAISLKQTADYTVVATWAVTPDRDLLLIDRIREHLDNPEQQKQISLIYNKYSPNYLKIERVAYQLAIIQQLRRQGLPVREYLPVKDKVSRASTASVYYEAGKVYHPKGAMWLAEWEEELLMFPLGSHDDQVDTLSMAAEELGTPGKVGGMVMATGDEELDELTGEEEENLYLWR